MNAVPRPCLSRATPVPQPYRTCRGATHGTPQGSRAGRTVAPQVSGGTLWEFAPPALVPDLEVGRLGRQAALLAEAGEAEAAHVRSLAAAAEARCLPST